MECDLRVLKEKVLGRIFEPSLQEVSGNAE
jgi:hypothetical protein